MPDPSGLLPPLDSSQYPGYLDLLRKQQMAQMLTQAFQQSNQTPASWNSMAVVPKKSMFSQVANIAEGLAAGKTNKDAWNAQKNYLLAPYGQSNLAPSGAQSFPAGDAPQASTPGVTPTSAKPALLPSTVQTDTAPAAVAAAQASQPNSMYLTGEPITSNRLYQMMGPQEYAKALAGRYTPTDLEKKLRGAGIDPNSPEGQAAFAQSIKKENYIAPLDLREGGMAFDPITRQPVGYNPKLPVGSQPVMGANGLPTGVQQLPGAAGAIEAAQEAESLGKTRGQYNVLPTGGGGSTVIPPGGGAIGRPAPRVGQPSAAPASAPAPPGFEGMPKLPVSSALGAPDAYTEGRLKAAGTKDAELASKYGSEADLADQKLQYNTDARKLLDTAELGPNSEWLTENRAKLAEWGVPENLIPGSGKVTDTMELNKYLKQSALQGARQIFGSRMTQMEVRLQHEELSPSTSMTRDAIASLMRTDDIKQQYAKQRAADYGAYQAAGGDPLRFESWYAKTHPLTEFAKKAAVETPATPTAATPKVTRQIGGKTYYQQNGKWYEQ